MMIKDREDEEKEKVIKKSVSLTKKLTEMKVSILYIYFVTMLLFYITTYL